MFYVCESNRAESGDYTSGDYTIGEGREGARCGHYGLQEHSSLPTNYFFGDQMSTAPHAAPALVLIHALVRLLPE